MKYPMFRGIDRNYYVKLADGYCKVETYFARDSDGNTYSAKFIIPFPYEKDSEMHYVKDVYVIWGTINGAKRGFINPKDVEKMMSIGIDIEIECDPEIAEMYPELCF